MSSATEHSLNKRKRPLTAIAIEVVTTTCVIGALIWLTPGEESAAPFSDAAELQGALNGLPVVGLPERPVAKSVWRQYETVAFRVNATSPEIVKTALSQFANDPTREFFSEAKPMILLRVCFEFPKSSKPVPQITQGWIGVSVESRSQASVFDPAWPVGRRFGSFYLKDFLEGYRGRIYDPVVEYEWMLAHCEKRKR